MTHPMLEKVARAIAVSQGHHGHVSYAIREREMLNAARAAVQALLEPDEDLLADGAVEADTTLRAMRDGYQAMLLPLVEGEG